MIFSIIFSVVVLTASFMYTSKFNTPVINQEVEITFNNRKDTLDVRCHHLYLYRGDLYAAEPKSDYVVASGVLTYKIIK